MTTFKYIGILFIAVILHNNLVQSLDDNGNFLRALSQQQQQCSGKDLCETCNENNQCMKCKNPDMNTQNECMCKTVGEFWDNVNNRCLECEKDCHQCNSVEICDLWKKDVHNSKEEYTGKKFVSEIAILIYAAVGIILVIFLYKLCLHWHEKKRNRVINEIHSSEEGDKVIEQEDIVYNVKSATSIQEWPKSAMSQKPRFAGLRLPALDHNSNSTKYSSQRKVSIDRSPELVINKTSSQQIQKEKGKNNINNNKFSLMSESSGKKESWSERFIREQTQQKV